MDYDDREGPKQRQSKWGESRGLQSELSDEGGQVETLSLVIPVKEGHKYENHRVYTLVLHNIGPVLEALRHRPVVRIIEPDLKPVSYYDKEWHLGMD